MRVRLPLVAIAVVSAALLPFIRVLPAWFVADDYLVIPRFTHGDASVWSFALSAFTSTERVPTNFYRPLPFVTLFAEARAWGAAAAGFHATNLLLHASNAALVWWIARRIARNPPVTALAAATLFFAAHPRRVEPVAWISARPDLLCTLFALTMAASWIRWRQGDGPAWLLASVGAWWGAALSKESALLLPAALPLLRADATHDRPTRRRVALWAFGVSLPAYLMVRRSVLGTWIGGYGADVFSAPRSAAGVIKQLAYAVLPPFDVNGWGVLAAGAAAGALLVGFAWWLWRCRRVPGAGFALAWTAAAILPVATLPISLTTTFNDRLMYLPAVGMALALGVMLGRSPIAARLCVVVALVLAAAYTAVITERWRVAGDLTGRIAAAIAAGVATPDRANAVYFAAVPDSFRGAYMLRSGLREAVAVKGGARVERLVPVARYFLTSTDMMPIVADKHAQRVIVRSVGGPQLLPAEQPPGVAITWTGGADRFGRRGELTFETPHGAAVYIIGPKSPTPVVP